MEKKTIKPLPNCLVLTVPKTGSTSLSDTMRDHPDICMPLGKETWFFDDFCNHGLEYLHEKYSHWRGEKVICDFVSTLINEEEYTTKIKKHFDSPKLIYLIRLIRQ
mgnify:CR=1 FL=1